MRKLNISDITLRRLSETGGRDISFKEKIETAKLLDKIKAYAIELPMLSESKADEILVKTVALSVKNSIVAVPVGFDVNDIERIWNCLKDAVKPRLQVLIPLSTAQMEYRCHIKPAKIPELTEALISKCAELCGDVEFIAEDACRSDRALLENAIRTAIRSGASAVTVCDNAGNMLPDEFGAFVLELKKAVPETSEIEFGIQASDALELGAACCAAAVKTGVDTVKTTAFRSGIPSLNAVAQIIRARGDELGVESDIVITELNRASDIINSAITEKKSVIAVSGNSSLFSDDAISFSCEDDITSVTAKIKRLGYELSAEDNSKIYQEFLRISKKKKNMSAKELDAIIASVALQVPPTYRVSSYVINCGNVISSSANIALEKDGKIREGISLGDGPIDAAFLAIEQIIGHHYELDDFQIQSVTEGREAMGSAVVKLRADGRLFSGKGISTDIVGASIRAYINALNKIVFEEG